MKNLIMRNLKLRQLTLITYAIALLFYPIYASFAKDSITYYIFGSLAFILVFIIFILDSGHLFRVHKRLGGNNSYLIFGSLPVSKKDLLNSNYITCIIFTFLGALVLYLYDDNSMSLGVNDIYFPTFFNFIVANFLSLPVAFSKMTELRRSYISYIFYIITIAWLLPLFIAIVINFVDYFIFNSFTLPKYYVYILNYGLIAISIVALMINYFIQYRKITRQSI
ncbi:phenol-soluble modulin export ABC transporter permease subunit PmtB [Staphylococcus simiae]|uniref:Uncharacterized protein n=1 Tax=Staphylococcus simiae CCM 7213 = CCUG 51256 TaxID=911238 RepID=G5JLF7_9STAP|nr:ABC-2 transporter permease [Staphylococcus simiae]EHJ06976.1 hypothetical protein SS7213T_11620 [Staphylococcus simiae CCM 7213 = CCUG 51256]SNV76372.1 membrane protein [Staphylococcus simiae]